MTRKIRIYIEPSWDWQGHEGVIEVDDESTDDEVIQIAEEWVQEQCPWGWEEIEDE